MCHEIQTLPCTIDGAYVIDEIRPEFEKVYDNGVLKPKVKKNLRGKRFTGEVKCGQSVIVSTMYMYMY